MAITAGTYLADEPWGFLAVMPSEPLLCPHREILNPAVNRGDVRDGTSGTGVRVFSPRFQPAAGEIFF
jgi:hypothetical protein